MDHMATVTAPVAASRPKLHPIDTSGALATDEPIPERLLSAISDVLAIPRSQIQLFDSFSELGGEDDTAAALVDCCATRGMSLRTEDVDRCKTVAELQTCVRPLQAPATPQSHDTDDMSTPVSPIFSPGLRPGSNASSDSSSSLSHVSSDPRALGPTEFIVTEALLMSTSQVPQATLTIPRSGLLSEKIVAFVTLAGTSVSSYRPTGDAVQLVPQSSYPFIGPQVAALRALLENSSQISAIPDLWIVLEWMPTTEFGGPERSQLLGWAESVSDDTYHRVMSLESRELMQEPSTEAEHALQRIIGHVLNIPADQISMAFSFGQLGGDHIAALRLVSLCRAESILLATEDVIQSDSIAHLAFLASWKGVPTRRWTEEVYHSFELSPIQNLYFQTPIGGDHERRLAMGRDYRFNQSMLYRVTSDVAVEDVHAAIEAIVGHHAMLRSRFRRGAESWSQDVLPEISASYRFGEHVVSANEDVLGVISCAQSVIDIETGPVFAAEFMRTPRNERMIYLVAHHLVVDLFSWRIIVRDLSELLHTGCLYSERAMPFRQWNELQRQQIATIEHATHLPFDLEPVDFAFWGVDPARNTYGDVAEASFSLGSELTSILQTTCNNALRTETTDIFIAALVLSFCHTFPERSSPTVWNQEHGREPWSLDINIAETVGWFTTMCPVRTGSDLGADFLDVLRRTKDIRRSIPRRGWAHFASHLLGPDALDNQSKIWPFEIMFTYGGSLQNLEAENGILEPLPVPGRTLNPQTSDIGSAVGRIALFEVSTLVDCGVSKIRFLYNQHSAYQDRIVTWVTNYEYLLLEAIGRLRYRAQELTLADIPLINATYDGLAKLNGDRLRFLNLTSTKDIESVLPATPNQQAVLISQMQTTDSCYLHSVFEFIPLASEQSASIDSARICAAWKTVVERHPSLRTVFVESVSEDGLFDQVILRKYYPEILFIASEANDAAILALNTIPPLRTHSAQPQHRLSVCKTPSSVLLKIEISQAVCDAISLGIIMNDLLQWYKTGQPLQPIQGFSYPEYLQLLRAKQPSGTRAFWTVQLREYRPCLFPALSNPRRGAAQITHAKLDVNVGDVSTFCQTRDVKLQAVIRLSWALVLRAFTGLTRVCFGYRMPGREGLSALQGIGGAVGAFENTVICAFDLASHRPLLSALEASEKQIALYEEHQTVPVAEIQHDLGLQGSLLFNTCLAVQDTSAVQELDAPRSQVQSPCEMMYNTLEHDLSLFVSTQKGKLELTICHRILSTIEAHNVANTLESAIRAIIGVPNASVGGVDFFSDRDFAQLPFDEPPTPKVPDSVLYSLISRHISQRPESPAVCAWDGDFSFAQMERLTLSLSYRLVAMGVTPGLPVPVVLGKTRWAVVAMLSVLRAGGCIVPVDESDPSFAEAVVKQLDSNIIICTSLRGVHSTQNPLSAQKQNYVVVDEGLFANKFPSEPQTSWTVKSGDPACLLFTPASSRAKGIRGSFFTQEALSLAFLAQGSGMRLDPTSRVMNLSTFISDTALVETLATLVHGGCVCVPSQEERKTDLASAVRRMNVTWTYMTPIIARRYEPSDMPSLSVVCFRTRRLDEETCARWMSQKTVLLCYGAPEICPLGISALEVSNPILLTRIAAPFIGKFWIVNQEDHRRLMPIGTIGELVIESPTLAHRLMHGHTPASTLQLQQAAEDKGDLIKTRYFKTGHKVRYMVDGTMEFVTSSRNELSIDGKVVSLPEVEQHLRKCLGPSIEVAVEPVMPRNTSGPVLAAFVEFGPKLFDGPDDLLCLSARTKENAFIAKQLAEAYLHMAVASYKVPPIFIPLKRLPITSSLKINRTKLQRMASALTEAELLSLASVPNPGEVSTVLAKPLPLTKVEERMRSVWVNLLGIDENLVTGTQSFLRLGGDRHLAAELVVACRREGLNVSLAHVLNNATLTDLCQHITMSEERFGEADCNIPGDTTLLGSGLTRALLASLMGMDLSSLGAVAEATGPQIQSLERALRTSDSAYNYITMNFTGVVDCGQLRAACAKLAEMHPILRTAFLIHERNVFQAEIKDFIPPMSRQSCPGWRLSSLTEKLIRKDQATGITMIMIPATKFFFIDGGRQSTLVMRLSAAQYDGQSLPMFFHDLKQLYSGEPVPRRPTYVEVTKCIRSAIDQGAVQYWTQILQGSTMTQVVAQVKPYVPCTTSSILTQRIQVAELSLDISFDTVLKVAWGAVLATLARSSDVVFGEVVDGRHLRFPGGNGIAGVLGPVTNVIPVRIRFPDAPSTALDLLQNAHMQRVAGIPFENIGLLELVEKCTPWPYWTQYSTVVHHTSHSNRYIADVSGNFVMGTASCKVDTPETRPHGLYDILVRSEQGGDGSISLSLQFSERRVPPSFAGEVLQMLCSTIRALTSTSIMEPFVLDAQVVGGTTQQIPLPQVDFDAAPTRLASALSHEHQLAIHQAIESTWTHILDPRILGVPEPHVRSAAFYDLWGCLLPAYRMAELLPGALSGIGISSLEGLYFSMEEIVENPTMSKQLEMVARKVQHKSERHSIGPALLSPTASVARGIRRLATTSMGNRVSFRRTSNMAAVEDGLEIKSTGAIISHEVWPSPVSSSGPVSAVDFSPRTPNNTHKSNTMRRASNMLGRMSLTQPMVS